MSSLAITSPLPIEMLEDGYGETRLSREKAKRIAAWNDLDKAMNESILVKGLITGKVKGGLTVMTNGIRAFLPGSLVDTRPVKDTTPFEGKEFEFKVIKLDRKRNNVVVSRRAVLEANMGEERQKLLETLQEGTIVKGIVKNITDYGAFVDLGGIDGLLHITDLAWRRVRHPSEVINVGDEVTAKVLKFDQEKNRVSLGMKQLGEDPWVGIARRYPSRHSLVRQGHQPDRLRFIRRDRTGHRRLGARFRNGLDQQEHSSVQGRAAWR
jgi:small subunit ribosomal protein S1